MALINYAEKTRTRRFASKITRPKKTKRVKSLQTILQKHSGRSHGRITVRHQGGRQKRYYRMIDFKRDKFDVEGTILALEYDPNRNVDIALVSYSDGDKRYILAPKGIKVGAKITSGPKSEIRMGNTLPLKSLPIGTIVNNVDGKFGRSAGVGLTLQAKEAGFAHLKMPSTEIRMVSLEALATVGVLGNEDFKNINLGKAGRKRHMGIRPTVRGTAMDPDSHPHGGGEARSGVGRKKPMTVYGRPAVGNTRKKNKWTDKYRLKRRKK